MASGREVNPAITVAIIEFVRTRIDAQHSGLLAVFDRLRRKRNLALYDDTRFVSIQEAQKALAAARRFIDVIRADVSARKP